VWVVSDTLVSSVVLLVLQLGGVSISVVHASERE